MLIRVYVYVIVFGLSVLPQSSLSACPLPLVVAVPSLLPLYLVASEVDFSSAFISARSVSKSCYRGGLPGQVDAAPPPRIDECIH